MFKPRPHSCRSGFTLVELLVAMAILTVIVAALGTIMGTASNLTTTNDNHINADGRARTVFDRMANDFAQMVKRSDVDFIFCKATGNDTMFFYTEGASYYDGNPPTTSDYKNRVSLVGYRVDNSGNATTNPSYGQMERLGKALMWDTKTGSNPAAMVFLNYPVPETGGTYSAAYTPSTLAGAYESLGSSGGSLVGTPANNFNDGADSSYHPLASNVFRFEYSFQLRDGTQSDIPVMQKATAQDPNGVPVSNNLTAGAPPTDANDSTQSYAVGSRWYDTANHIGYICLDATQGNAVWHEIGIQDVSAVVVTIAVISDQGMVFLNSRGGSLGDIAAKLPDYDPTTTSTGHVTGDPAYLLDPTIATSWAYALLPGNGVSTVAGASHLPQNVVSQIRLYQRFFYINNT